MLHHRLPLALLALAVLLPARAADAHGGKLALRTTAGSYRIEAVVSRVGGAIDESVTVTGAASGRPVVTAVLTLTLAHADGRTLGPFVAHGVGGLFEARYPPPPGDSGWTVTITVSGPGGEAEASHPYTAPGGSSPLLTILAGVLLFVVMPVVAWRIWWRKEPEP